MTFDKSSKIPIYFQLKEIIKKDIINQRYTLNQLLPSERELCAQYSISRMTVRQAIGELENEGYVYKVQGKGTFASSGKIVQNLATLTSFSEDMYSMGRQPASKVLQVNKIPAYGELAKKLNLNIGEPVILYERLRYADSQTVCIEKTYLRGDIISAEELMDAKVTSLYKFLREEKRVHLKGAYESIETLLISGTNAQILEVPENTLGLLLERLTYNLNGEPIEFVRSIYRGDTYKFVIELNADY